MRVFGLSVCAAKSLFTSHNSDIIYKRDLCLVKDESLQIQSEINHRFNCAIFIAGALVTFFGSFSDQYVIK